MISFIIETLDSADDVKFIADLYEEYTPWMKKRAKHFMKKDDPSLDVVQDCMVNMIKHIDTLKRLSQSQRRAYVSISIDNTAKNLLKKNSKTVNAFEAQNASLEYLAEDYSVADEVERKFNYEAMKAGIPYLNDRDRELIILKFDFELSDEEISEIIGIKKNSVRMTIRRSIDRLSKIIEEAGGK